LSSGAFATLVVLYGRRKSPSTDDPETNPVEQPLDNAKQKAAALASVIRSRLLATKIKLRLWFRRMARITKGRLRRMVPSRQMVLRLAFLLVGTALVVLSLVGFTKGRILESSILLPLGYGIAVSSWFLSWRRLGRGPDVEELEYLAAIRQPPPSMPRRVEAAIRPTAKAVARHADNPATPAPHFRFGFDILDQSEPPTDIPTLQLADPLPADNGVRLQCGPCGKQFHVRGQGEIAYRLVPCPECGSAMESLGAKRTDILPKDPTWVPIVSVFCKQCSGLIDVPYSTFGTSIPCPRCQADMFVPRVASA
jgi:hypothetical protein